MGLQKPARHERAGGSAIHQAAGVSQGLEQHPEVPMSEIDRRSFLSTALAAIAPLTQRPAGSKSQRVDIHHHFAPPAWIAEVKGRPLLQTANTTWTPEKSIEDLDRAGSAAAVISITNPGLWFGDNQTTNRLARACNEYGEAGAAVSEAVRPVRGDA